MNEADQHKLVDACKTFEEKFVVLVFLDTGLRVSEFCNLKKEAINWQENNFRVYGKGGPYGKESKFRIVPMSQRVRMLFNNYFSMHGEVEWGVRTVQRTIKRVASRTEITAKVTPHVLRHTFAVNFHRKTTDLRALQLILGHDSIATTQIYLSYSPSDVMEAFKKFDEV